jgi:4'-phosphopantetheinyl transferase
VEDTWGPLTLPSPGTPPAIGICHLWSARTTGAASYQALLDAGELAAAERFRVARAKDAFVASRVAQRLVLGRYLGCRPESVKIARDCRHCGGDHGRPYVSGAPVDFSVSHSAGWLLLAVVAGGLVGVDLEQVSDARAVDDLASRVLGPAEQERFLLVPRPDRAAWFIWAWTRKEAALKLTGHGIVGPLSGLDITGPTAVASPPPSGWPAEPIHLRDVPAGPDLRAALATTVPVTNVVHCGPALAPGAGS